MEKISMILNKIENKKVVLPEFQREFTWNKAQAKNLIGSFLHNYPTGALLFWMTKEKMALKNMPEFEFKDLVEVILDGQQRLTTLYFLIKDSIPPFYTKKDITNDIRNLYYNLETRDLEYYKKLKMKNKPFWVKVTDCFKNNKIEPFNIADQIIESDNNLNEDKFHYAKKLLKNLDDLKEIQNKSYPIIYVDDSSTLIEALTVFDRINSAGTPLTDADIALAHMCSKWPDTRRKFKQKIRALKKQGFEFDLKFLVRGMNAVINHRADYKQLHNNNEKELKHGFDKLSDILDFLINILKGAFIYGTDDLNTPNVLIPLIGYLSLYGPTFKNDKILKKSLYWMYAALYQRRFTSSVDQKLEADLNALKKSYTPDIPPLDDLITILEEDVGSPIVSKNNINSRGVEHPFYNMMNIVTRSKGGVDWSNGINFSKPIGNKFKIERHHIFPKSFLKQNGYDTGNVHHNRLVHEIANRVPLTKKANMEIFDNPPEKYLPSLENNYQGNLKKFFIPQNKKLWKIENYVEFLEKRRELIAEGINEFMQGLLENSETENTGFSIHELIVKNESRVLEFKSTIRWSLRTENYDKKLEKPILKTICGFLNSEGGTLLIGVTDNGSIFGIEKDIKQFGNIDKYQLHLSNIISSNIGGFFMSYVNIKFENIKNKTVCRIDVEKSSKPAYYKKGNEEKFYVRLGNFTKELPLSEIKYYIDENF